MRAVAVFLAAGMLAACGADEPVPATEVRHVGPGDLAAELVRLYDVGIPGASFSSSGAYEGSIAALAEIEQGEADLTFAAAGATYEAFTSGTALLPRPHANLTALAVVRSSTLHLVLGPGLEAESLAELSGVRVATGSEWSNSAADARRILPLFGVPEAGMVTLPPADVAVEIRNGTVGAAFLMLPYPSDAVASILANPGSRLFPVSAAELNVIREADLFLKPAVIPPGAYGDHPAIDTVATDRILVVGDGLSEDIVFAMLSVLFDSLPDLSREYPSLAEIRLDRAAATPIPLHPGAARYYRARQLFH